MNIVQHIYRRAQRGILASVGLALALLIMGLVQTGQAADAMMVTDAWARPSIGAAGNGAAYMTVMNHGSGADRLVAVKTDVARRAEIHTHIMDGDVMRMRRVEGGVEVPLHGQVDFKPGGLHVMLFGLNKKLAVGDSFPLTLVFEQGGETVVTVKVHKTAPKPDDGHNHD